jgi:hypothetical protein
VQLATTAEYFATRRALLDYPRFRAQGYHIGSGLAESACCRLVGQRAKGPGMHWTVPGAQAITTLRAAYLSDGWDEVENPRRCRLTMPTNPTCTRNPPQIAPSMRMLHGLLLSLQQYRWLSAAVQHAPHGQLAEVAAAHQPLIGLFSEQRLEVMEHSRAVETMPATALRTFNSLLRRSMVWTQYTYAM